MKSVSSRAIRRLAASLSVIVFAGTTVDAIGHAVAVGMSLQQQPVRAGVAGRVTLRFNGAIEIGLSRVFLVSKGDVHQALSITVGSKRGELVVDVPSLAAGDYALKYRVFAVDGHLTEDVIRFSVTR